MTRTFYTYKNSNDFYIYDVVFAENEDVILVQGNTVTNISKTNRSIANCPKDILSSLLSRCIVISSD